MKRLISKRDEEILRACHQDFDGLSTKDVAKKLNITVSTVQHALKAMEKKIPTMFPILTPRQKHMEDLLDSGKSLAQIAELTGTTEGNVGAFVTKLHGKGHHLRRQTYTVPYENYMDHNVRERF